MWPICVLYVSVFVSVCVRVRCSLKWRLMSGSSGPDKPRGPVFILLASVIHHISRAVMWGNGAKLSTVGTRPRSTSSFCESTPSPKLQDTQNWESFPRTITLMSLETPSYSQMNTIDIVTYKNNLVYYCGKRWLYTFLSTITFLKPLLFIWNWIWPQAMWCEDFIYYIFIWSL